MASDMWLADLASSRNHKQYTAERGFLRVPSGDDKLQLSLEPLGGFCKLWALFVGVLVKRARLLGGYIRAPDFWKLPLGFGWSCCEHLCKETSFRMCMLALKDHAT